MDFVKKLFGGDIRQLGMIGALVFLIAFFAWSTDGVNLTPDNVNNIIRGNAHILVLAIGMVMVIIAGHIDLSVGSVSAAVGIVVAIAMRDWGLHWTLAILLGLAFGALIGTWQGWWVAKIGIPAFIVTLAGMLFFRGLNQFIGKSNTVPVPPEFQVIGAGSLPEWGPNTGYNNLTVLLGIVGCAAIVIGTLRNRQKLTKINAEVEEAGVMWARLILICLVIMGVMLLIASGAKGFPVSGLILVFLVIIYGFLTSKMILGRHIYAVGGNRHAAELSGVKSTRVNFFVMANMAVLAALAGMMFVARSNASGPFDGVGWELDAIAAVFIGGAAVTGGVGTVVGSIVGGLVMAVLNNGLQLEGIGADRTQMIKGLVLLIAVAFDLYSKKQGKPSLIGSLMKKRGGGAGSGGAAASTHIETQNPARAAVQDTSTTIGTES
jgi:putative multiple sugar transport system permease protein